MCIRDRSRTISRRAETHVVALSKNEEINKDAAIYLNRLSDLMFVLARSINNRKDVPDIVWKPWKILNALISINLQVFHAEVAQPGRAPRWRRGCREFKSPPRHYSNSSVFYNLLMEYLLRWYSDFLRITWQKRKKQQKK